MNLWLGAFMVAITAAMCWVWWHAGDEHGYERGLNALQENYKREGFGPDT